MRTEKRIITEDVDRHSEVVVHARVRDHRVPHVTQHNRGVHYVIGGESLRELINEQKRAINSRPVGD
jgi:hypothetical protein